MKPPKSIKQGLVYPVMLCLIYGGFGMAPCDFKETTMKKIPLIGKRGKGKFALVDNEDFEKASQRRWFIYIQKNKNNVYAITNINSRRWYLHWEVFGKAPKGMNTDHINRNGLDNQKSNLRHCTIQQNVHNRGIQRNNKLGYKGVGWCNTKQNWMAAINITINGIRKHKTLGRFKNKKEAALCYDKGAKKYFGKYGYLNFPNEKEA